MHAVFDTESLKRQAKGLADEKQREKRLAYAEEQIANMVLLNDTDSSPANAERQLGRPLTTEEFEARLRRLNANLIFEDSPNPSKKRLYVSRPDGKHFICLYERGVMPEHSVLKRIEEDVIDPFVLNNPTKALTRNDLPAFIQDPGTADNPIGAIRWKDPDAPLPGTTRVVRAGGEKTRGWRTVLIYLIWEDVSTPAQIERIFGSDDRPEWAAKTGKQKVATQL